MVDNTSTSRTRSLLLIEPYQVHGTYYSCTYLVLAVQLVHCKHDNAVLDRRTRQGGEKSKQGRRKSAVSTVSGATASDYVLVHSSTKGII